LRNLDEAESCRTMDLTTSRCSRGATCGSSAAGTESPRTHRRELGRAGG